MPEPAVPMSETVLRTLVVVSAEEAAGLAGGLDGLVLDLAGLDPAALDGAGCPIGAVVRGGGGVYLGGLADPRIERELGACMPAAPGRVFVEAEHGRDVAHLASRLAVHEAENGLADGATRIVAVLGSALAVLNAASFVGASPRLVGLAWNPETLATGLGVSAVTAAGEWSAPLAHARGLVRLAAAAAGVEAIDAEGAHVGERDGFAAVLRRGPGRTVRPT